MEGNPTKNTCCFLFFCLARLPPLKKETMCRVKANPHETMCPSCHLGIPNSKFSSSNLLPRLNGPPVTAVSVIRRSRPKGGSNLTGGPGRFYKHHWSWVLQLILTEQDSTPSKEDETFTFLTCHGKNHQKTCQLGIEAPGSRSVQGLKVGFHHAR